MVEIRLFYYTSLLQFIILSEQGGRIYKYFVSYILVLSVKIGPKDFLAHQNSFSFSVQCACTISIIGVKKYVLYAPCKVLIFKLVSGSTGYIIIEYITYTRISHFPNSDF